MQRFFLTATMACFTFLLSYAQPSLKTTVDKNEILIGDQFKLKIEIKDIAEGYKITLPVIPDSLSHFEVVSRDKIDSSYQDKKLSGISQTITFTSFDSGKWVLPSFLVNVDPLKDDTTYNFFTDSVPVTVSFSLSDTTSVIRDIKPIREADTVNVIWYWIGAGVLLAALIIFLIWFYKYWRKNKIDVPFKSKISPYDEAMKELDKLKALNISSPEEIRVAHIKLGEILKRYLTCKQNTSYLNKTTSEILISLSEQAVDKEMLAIVASSLRCSDAVKFAKYLPPTNETAESMVSIKEVISQIHKQTTIDKPQKPNFKP